MKRKIDDLTKYLTGKMEKEEHISEISDTLYSLAVKDYFRGYRDGTSSISYLQECFSDCCDSEADLYVDEIPQGNTSNTEKPTDCTNVAFEDRQIGEIISITEEQGSFYNDYGIMFSKFIADFVRIRD